MKKHQDYQEIERIRTLLSFDILDTEPEEEFQVLVQLISSICDVPVAIISLIDERRQWFKAKIGLDATEIPTNETICQYTLLQDEILEITDALNDYRVRENPRVTAENGIRYYAGISLQAKNGYNIGTLCVADTKPRQLTPSQKEAMKLLSRQVMILLEARKKNKRLSEELERILQQKIYEAKEQLSIKEKEYQHLLETIKRSNSVVEFSPAGEILSTNQIFSELVGYSEKELLQMNQRDLVDPKYSDKYILSWKNLQKGKNISGRFRRISKEQGEIWMQATYSPVKASTGEVEKIIMIAQDITSDIHSEKALEKAKLAAESLNKQKDTFIANMSHEIRTPIHAVLGFSELLLEQEEDPQKLQYLKAVKTAGDNLMFIINDILDLSKIQAGVIQMHATNFNLKEVVENVLSILHLKAKQKHLRMSFRISEEVPDFLIGDRNRLTQILLNLLNNALKFTLKGKVELLVDSLGSNGNKLNIQFAVKDTGMGIAAENLEKIFERFSQADESISRNFGGTGLGLNISRQLVEKQDGSMTVESTLGKGSTFKFFIPYSPGEESSRLAVESESKNRDLKGRILLCEDNELNQRLIEAILNENNFEIDIAGNGVEGIELFNNKEFDLVLMDLQMPRQDGRETTRIIREDLQSKIPIVALTANFLNTERTKCLESGFDDYLSKPFKKEELFGVIRRWMFKEHVSENQEQWRPGKELVSLENLREMSGGNREFEQEMLEVFIKNSTEIMSGIRQAVSEENVPQIHVYVHKLKGSFGVIGADLQLLEEIEDASDPKTIRQLVLLLEKELQEIIKLLNADYITPES